MLWPNDVNQSPNAKKRGIRYYWPCSCGYTFFTHNKVKVKVRHHGCRLKAYVYKDKGLKQQLVLDFER